MNKTERQVIKRKTDAMNILEEIYKDKKLNFDYKTSFFYKPVLYTNSDHWTHSFYEVSYIENNQIKTIGFYAKRGYKTLSFYLERAMKKGRYEQHLSEFNENDS